MKPKTTKATSTSATSIANSGRSPRRRIAATAQRRLVATLQNQPQKKPCRPVGGDFITIKSKKMEPYFTITTSAETGKKIEDFFNSSVNQHRSIALRSIKYENGLASVYCVATIDGKNGQKIVPSDIFFLGLFCQ